MMTVMLKMENFKCVLWVEEVRFSEKRSRHWKVRALGE